MTECELKRKLSRHIYCKNCGFTGLIDAFPLNGPQDAADSEKYCPRCFRAEMVNAADVKFCKECRKRPVEEDDYSVCVGCAEMYEAAFEHERDLEPF